MTRISCVYTLGLALAMAGPAAAQDPGVTLSYRTTSDWGTGFNGQVTLLNGGSVPVRGWVLEFDFSRRIDSIWDARVVERTGTRYRIASAGWNDAIEIGASVSFGFTGSPGEVGDGPSNVRVSAGGAVTPGGEQSVSGATAAVAIRETGRWAGGYSATATITNLSAAQEIRRWTLRLGLDAGIDSAWGAQHRLEDAVHEFTADAVTEAIAPRSSVVIGFTGSGNLETVRVGACTLNGGECTVTVAKFAAQIPRPPIAVEGDQDGLPVTQWVLTPGPRAYRLSSSAAGAVYRAVSSNPAVARAIVAQDILTVDALEPGRAFVRIDDLTTGASRAVGVRVDKSEDEATRLPPYVALGSVSEDTADHLAFWTAIEPGPRNKRVDARYIYLNGGPVNGWDTWGNGPGSRAANFIRNSRARGMIPFFVFYNIPDGAESYERDLEHAQSLDYMTAYFANLRLFLDIVRRESPDDMVGVILEPDFLGYLAQNAARPAAEIPAATAGVYRSGVLGDDDPVFPDSVRGLVEAINYVISKHAPNVYFGWQMNLWASPPGGYTTSIPGRGIIRKTDEVGIEAGRQAIVLEAAAITRYYLEAGIATHGAGFVSIDKYGLDAGAEPGAGDDPAKSIWFWNAGHWHNYLWFVRSIFETAELPVVLWQLPVGRINATLAKNPYDPSGRFQALGNTHRSFEDSAATFFFGDRFEATGPRGEYFAADGSGDEGVTAGEGVVNWRGHMKDAADAGVRLMLFGAGVGASTSSVGDPPSDGYWWIVKAQQYFSNGPEPLKP
ncbi:MAG: cellulose binding domain-containing protein [Bryobacteraceae bacterium]